MFNVNSCGNTLFYIKERTKVKPTIYELSIDENKTKHKQSDNSKLYFKQKKNLESLRSINNKLKLYIIDIDKFGYTISKSEKTMLKKIRNKMETIRSYEDDL